MQPRLRQVARGVDASAQHVERGGGSRLATQRHVQDRAGVAYPGSLDLRAGVQYGDHVGVGVMHGREELGLGLVHAHVRAVEALALGDLVQADCHDDHIGGARELDGLVHELRGGDAAALESLGIAHVRKAVLARGEHTVERVELGAVDQRRSGTLVAWGLAEVADERHARALREGQQAATVSFLAVLQEHDALCRDLACERMVGVRVEGGPASCLDRGLRGEDEHERLADAVVHVALGKRAVVDGRLKLEHGIGHGTRHLEGRASAHACHVVVRAAPVSNDGATVAPLVAQDLLEQVLALVGIGAVHEVVAGHDGLGRTLLDGNLETGEVELAHGALVNDGV